MLSPDACKTLPPPLELDQDIAGFGVYLSFVITGWFTVFMVVLYYLLAFNPTLDPFRLEGCHTESTHKPNPIDLLIYNRLSYFTKHLQLRQEHTRRLFDKAFTKCLLLLADTQIVTGMAILISGYYTMSNGLAAHYWSMIVYLAWFSCLTHLSALTFLRNYLYHHPASRSWRLMMMSVLIILLIIAIFPTGYFEYLDIYYTYERQHYFNPDAFFSSSCEEHNTSGLAGTRDLGDSRDPRVGAERVGTARIPFENCTNPATVVFASTPAACLFKGGMQFNNPTPVSMLISMLLLMYGFSVRVCKVFKTISNKLSKTFQQDIDRIYICLIGKIDRKLSKMRPSLKFWMLSIILPFISGIYCTLRLFLDLYSSMAMEIISISLSGVWGTLRLNKLRSDTLEALGENKTWQFGQVMPLVLLGSPLLAISELVYKIYFPTQALNLPTPGNMDVAMVATPCARIIVDETYSNILDGEPSRQALAASELSMVSPTPGQTGRTREHILKQSDDLTQQARTSYSRILGFSILIVPCPSLWSFIISFVIVGIDKYLDPIAVQEPALSFCTVLLETYLCIIVLIQIEHCNFREGFRSAARAFFGLGFSLIAILTIGWFPAFNFLVGWFTMGGLFVLYIVFTLIWTCIRIRV